MPGFAAFLRFLYARTFRGVEARIARIVVAAHGERYLEERANTASTHLLKVLYSKWDDLMRTAFTVAIVLGLASSATAGDWPQWLGPNRDGVSEEVIAPWSKVPPVKWRREIGDGFSTPVVANGAFFVHAQVPKKDAEEVLCLDAATGEVRWSDTYDRESYASALGAGPRGTPVVDSGRLFTLGITGVLSCYDAKTGERRWQARPYADFKTSLPGFGVCSSPLVVGGKVILPVGGPGSAVVAYDVETGEVAWKVLDEPASSASPVAVTLKSGSEPTTFVVSQTTLRLVGLNLNDGSLAWEHPMVFQPSGVSPTPLVVEDTLVATTQDTGTLSLKIEPSDSAPKPNLLWWQQELSSYFSTGVVGEDGRVIIVTNKSMPLPRADLRCIDRVSGKEHWHKEGLGYFHLGVIRTGDNKLLILDDAGNLILADPAGNEFKELSRAKVCGGTFVSPVLANGLFYTRDAKEITCVQLAP